MSDTFILAALALAVSFIAVVLAIRGSGPRVTHIETRRKDDDEDSKR